MSIPPMEPIEHPPPRMEDYPLTLDKVRLFKRSSRERYEELAGVQPPEFDDNRLAKLWWDTTASDPQPYTHIDLTDGEISVVDLAGGIARTPNFPGQYRYPSWEPAATSATGGPTHLQNLISSEEEAQGLADEIGEAWRKTFGRGTITIDRPSRQELGIVWGDETRRIWYLVYPYHKRAAENCARVLRRKYQRGIGYPGWWRVTSPPPGAAWVPDTPPDGKDVPEMAIPIRALWPAEFVIPWGVGGWAIDHQDRPKGGGGVGGGSFTAEHGRKLNEIHEVIMRRLG